MHIADLLQVHGLLLRGGFDLQLEFDEMLLRQYPDARQLVLIGNAGSAIWPHLAAYIEANPEITDPLVAKVMSMPVDNFLDISPVGPYELKRGKGVFEAKPCAKCGELTFVDKLLGTSDGLICKGCADKSKQTGI